MNFQDISLKRRYKTYKDNIIQDFYIPTLEQSKIYKRAVGFFSSSALIELSKGISEGSGIFEKEGSQSYLQRFLWCGYYDMGIPEIYHRA